MCSCVYLFTLLGLIPLYIYPSIAFTSYHRCCSYHLPPQVVNQLAALANVANATNISYN